MDTIEHQRRLWEIEKSLKEMNPAELLEVAKLLNEEVKKRESPSWAK